MSLKGKGGTLLVGHKHSTQLHIPSEGLETPTGYITELAMWD